MSSQCCRWHTTTCGQVDVCCDQCPADRESLPKQVAVFFLGVIVLVLLAVGLA